MNTPVSGVPLNPTPMDGVPPVVKREEDRPSPSAITTEKTAVAAQGQLAEQTGNLSIATPSETHIVPTTKDKVAAIANDETHKLRQIIDAMASFLSKAVSVIGKAFNYLNVFAYFRKESKTEATRPVGAIQTRRTSVAPEKLVPAAMKLMGDFQARIQANSKILDEEGLFRLGGGEAEIRKLTDDLSKANLADALDMPVTRSGALDVHVITNALKRLFSDMQLFTQQEFVAMGHLLNGLDEATVVTNLQNFVNQLNPLQKQALNQMMNILGQVHSHSAENKMTLQALAIVVGPALFKQDDPTVLSRERNAIALTITNLIVHRDEIFV